MIDGHPNCPHRNKPMKLVRTIPMQPILHELLAYCCSSRCYAETKERELSKQKAARW
jgi:hypothetical protein